MTLNPIFHSISQMPLVTWVAYAALAFAGLVGVMALFFPEAFRKVAEVGGIWIDTAAAFKKIDTPFNVDKPFIEHGRVFGFTVLCGAAVLAWLTPTTEQWAWVGWTGTAALASIGAVAALCPNAFKHICQYGGNWVDTSKFFSPLDRRVNIDEVAYNHSRLFGGIVLIALTVIVGEFYM